MNDCFSIVTIHADPQSIKKLEVEFKKALFLTRWLKNLLLHIGYTDDQIRNGDIVARGNVAWWDVTDSDEITLNVESAYVPNVRCIKEFVGHYVKDAEIVFDSEEPSTGLFWSNDPHVIGTVFIDRWFDDEVFGKDDLKRLDKFVSTYFDCPEEIVRKGLEGFLGHRGKYDELTVEMSAFVRKNGGPDSYIYFHTYQEMSLENVT